MARVLIAGGGVMGWSTAMWLCRMGHDASRIVVVERGGEDWSSTSRSAGGIRHQFTLRENVELSHFSSQYIRDLEGTKLATGFKEGGYLFLASSKEGEELLRRALPMQRAVGAELSLLTSRQIQARWPFINVEDVRAGTIGERGEGWLDPHLLRASFSIQAKESGVSMVKGAVSKLALSGNRVTGVELDEGRCALPCDIFVNALGPSCAELLTPLGVDLPVRRRKRCIFYFECKDPLPRCPMIIDSSGVYMRPEGAGYISGVAPFEDADPDVLPGDFDVDETMWEERVWPSVAHRVPLLECVKLKSSWAGHYEYNTFDENAIIGPLPQVKNLFLINGFSGHGLQQSPAAGRALAELIVHGSFQTIDLSRFSFERIMNNTPLLEQNII